MSRANPYYYPEKLGLEKLAEHDFSDGDYCFDYRVIWRHTESGRLLTERDSGCSCPSPFEDYSSVESLSAFNADELVNEAKNEGKSEWYRGGSIPDWIRKIESIRDEQRRAQKAA
jgi:hypothetical protein